MEPARDRKDRQEERDTGSAKPLHPDTNDPTEGEPHSALSKPARDPDPTEYPDPYEQRPDPRDPDEEEPSPRPPSTSEPHPPQSYDELKPVKGDRED